MARVALADASPAPAVGAGQLWSYNETGGYLQADNLSTVLRFEVSPLCRYRQLASMPDDLQNAQHAGDTFHWNVFGDLDDAIGGEITEEEKVPTARFLAQQGKCVVKEFALAVPYTGLFDDLSEQPVRDVIKQLLKRHCARKLDNQAYLQFAKTPLKVTPDGAGGDSATDIQLTENGVPAGPNASPLTLRHLSEIILTMQNRDIPTWDHGDYYGIGRPTTWRTVKSDLENVHAYTDTGLSLIKDGETGRYDGMRLINQTNIAKQFTSAQSDQAFFMGYDAVAECVVIPEEIRGKIPDDYGRGKGVAYYAITNFAPTRLKASDWRVLEWAEV